MREMSPLNQVRRCEVLLHYEAIKRDSQKTCGLLANISREYTTAGRSIFGTLFTCRILFLDAIFNF